MLNVTRGNHFSSTAIPCLRRSALQAEVSVSDTAKEETRIHVTCAVQHTSTLYNVGKVVEEAAQKFGGLHRADGKPPAAMQMTASSSEVEVSSKTPGSGDGPRKSAHLPAAPSTAAVSSLAIPNTLGNIAKEYGEMHITAPTSPTTPRGVQTCPNNQSRGGRAIRKLKSLGSLFTRKDPAVRGDTARRTRSGPGRLTRGFQVFKEAAVRGLKRLASTREARNSNAEN